MTKKLILSVATLFVVMAANAAEPSDTLVDNRRPSHFHVGLELHTKYVWRGQEMMVSESAPVLFTELYYQYKGLRAYSKGGYATNGKFGQLNLGADYTYKWNIKCAGLPEAQRSQVTPDNFNIGQVYTGKLLQKTVPGGVVLVETNFEIKEG